MPQLNTDIYGVIRTGKVTCPPMYDESQADERAWQEAITQPQFANEVETDIKGYPLR